MSILVTGGAGYIGSHTCLTLLLNGFNVIAIDNLSNGSKLAIERVRKISKRDMLFYPCDITNRDDLEKIFAENEIECVIHFAGLKEVEESIRIPLQYYHNNVEGTLILMEMMLKFHVNHMVFSSSATVYGKTENIGATEDMPLHVTNPYGRTKLISEEILRDCFRSNPDLSISILRYFNPVGAHPSGLLGETTKGVPRNLMPFITQVASGKLERLLVFGGDYDTLDKTGVRDYIHIMDLAQGHVSALNYIKDKKGVFTHNLGTGKGYSVIEMIHAFQRVNGVEIPFQIIERRGGDVASCYADVTKAELELGFSCQYTIEDMCRDAWNFQTKNPNGYLE